MKSEEIKFTKNKPENFDPLRNNPKIELDIIKKPLSALTKEELKRGFEQISNKTLSNTKPDEGYEQKLNDNLSKTENGTKQDKKNNFFIVKSFKDSKHYSHSFCSETREKILSQLKSVLTGIDKEKIEDEAKQIIKQIINERQEKLNLTSYETYIPEIIENNHKEKIDGKSINYSQLIVILKNSIEELEILEEELNEKKGKLIEKLSEGEISIDEYNEADDDISTKILDIPSVINELKNHLKLNEGIDAFSTQKIKSTKDFIEKFNTIKYKISNNKNINKEEKENLIHNLNYYFFEKIKEEDINLKEIKNIFQEKKFLLDRYNTTNILYNNLTEKIEKRYDINTLLVLLKLAENEIIDPGYTFDFIFYTVIPIIDKKYNLNIDKIEKERDELIKEIDEIAKEEVGEIGYAITAYELKTKILPEVKRKTKKYDDKVISWAAEYIKSEKKLPTLREYVGDYGWDEEDKIKAEIKEIKEKIPKEENILIKTLMEIFVEHAYKNYKYNKEEEEWKKERDLKESERIDEEYRALLGIRSIVPDQPLDTLGGGARRKKPGKVNSFYSE